MPKRNGNNNKDKFVFTKDLNLIKPYTIYDLSMENYLSRFKPNDIILHNKNIGFALCFHRHFLSNKHIKWSILFGLHI